MYSGRIWRAERFGQPTDVLRIEENVWQAPSPGRVLLRVSACGVGLPDLLMTQGRYPLVREPPVEPGQEVAGEVVAVASGSAFKVGDRVMGATPFTEGLGGYADYAYVRESKSLLIPDGMSDVEAAGFMISFRTAHIALIERVPLERGQTLAVLGASGSSGLAAIALGKALGARVIAVAGSAEKLDFCARAGADAGIDYRRSDIGAELNRLTDGIGVDVIFDPVGGAAATQSLAGLRSRGRFAVIGFASGSWVDMDPQAAVLHNHTMVGVFAGGYSVAEDNAINTHLGEMAAAGLINTAVGPVHGFDQVPTVLEGLPRGGHPGKAVVQLDRLEDS